jgi:pilus assembly protein Flp/PilA
MLRIVRKFLADDHGATAIEYAMIAGLISIVIVVGVTSIGGTIKSQFFGPISNAL